MYIENRVDDRASNVYTSYKPLPANTHTHTTT